MHLKLKKALLGLSVLFLLIGTINAQQKQRVKVAFLIDQLTPEVQGYLRVIEDETRAVVGEDANLVFDTKHRFVTNDSEASAKKMYADFLESDADILITGGVTAYNFIVEQKEFPKPVILSGALPAELIQYTKAVGSVNLFDVVSRYSLAADLEAFRKIHEFQSLGIAATPAYLKRDAFNAFFTTYGKQNNVNITFLPYTTSNDLIQPYDSLDALYLTGAFLLNDQEIEKIAQHLIKEELPSFTSSGSKDVKLGLLATTYSDLHAERMMRRLSLQIESLVNNTAESSLPEAPQPAGKLTLNFNTLGKLDMKLRYSMLASANLVGDINQVIADKSYTLITAMNEVLVQNLSLKASERDVELAGQDAKQAKSAYLPNVRADLDGVYNDPDLAEVSNGQRPEFMLNGDITASQTIFSPDANTNIGVQKDLLKATEENYNADKLNSLFDVANAYMNILLLKTNLTIVSSNLDVTEFNLRIAEEKYEAGSSGKADVLRFRSQLAQNTQSFVESMNAVEQSYYFFNQTLNQPVNRKVNIEDATFEGEIFERYNYKELREILDNPSLREAFKEFLVIEAKKNAPELKSIDYSANAIKRSYNLATYGRFMPTVGAQAQYTNLFERSGVGSEFPAGFPPLPTDYYNVGVNVSIPIFRQNQQNINRQTALIQQDQIQINKANFELNIEQLVNSSVLELINQIANIQLSEVARLAAEENLELTQDAYRKGAVNWVQLIDAQTNYFQAKQSNATAKYSFFLAALQLERNIGKFFLLSSEEENQAFRDRFIEYIQNRTNE